MSLEPKYKYSAQIYAELFSAIGERIRTLVGVKTTMNIYSKAGYPVGKEDGAKLLKLLRIKGHNAATIMCLTCIGAEILEIGTEITTLTPTFSKVKSLNCPYANSLKKFKYSLVCGLCQEYNRGMHSNVGKGFKTMFTGYLHKDDEHSCTAEYQCDSPKDEINPYSLEYRFMIWLVKHFIDKNILFVDIQTRNLTQIEKKVIEVVGQKASMIPLRAAKEAGKYNGSKFRELLNLGESFEDGVKLVKEVRGLLRCKVKATTKDGESEIITTKCKWAKYSGELESKHMEVLCRYYTTGLLHPLSDYEVVQLGEEGGCHNRKICRQVIKKREEKEIENKEAYEAILDELVDAKTITASAIVTTSGLPVVSKMEKDVDEKLFAELSATMIGAGGTAINELKTGTSDRVILESSEARVVIIRAGGEMLLVAMSHLKTKLGLVLLRMGRAVEKIKGVG